MSKQVEFPCKVKIKATGEVLTATRQHYTCGIKVVELRTPGGRFVGDYAASAVVLLPSDPV